jgi:hypothetical protein
MRDPRGWGGGARGGEAAPHPHTPPNFFPSTLTSLRLGSQCQERPDAYHKEAVCPHMQGNTGLSMGSLAQWKEVRWGLRLQRKCVRNSQRRFVVAKLKHGTVIECYKSSIQ